MNLINESAKEKEATTAKQSENGTDTDKNTAKNVVWSDSWGWEEPGAYSTEDVVAFHDSMCRYGSRMYACMGVCERETERV